MPYTVSQIARKFGLSRSTLLYYDKIGLFSPARRSGADYRIYEEKDIRRMEEISRLREAGVPLQTIKKMIVSGSSRRGEILHRRLHDINDQMSHLRRQQKFIL